MSTDSFDAKAELQSNRGAQQATRTLNDNRYLDQIEQAIDRIPVLNRSLYKDAAIYTELNGKTLDYRINIIQTSIKYIKNNITELKQSKTVDELNNLNIRYKSLLELLGNNLTRSAYNFLKPDLVEKLIKPYEEALKKLQNLGYNTPGQIEQLVKEGKPPEVASVPDQSNNQQPPKEKEDVIALIFNMLYFVGGIVSAVLVVVLFILASFDLLKFIYQYTQPEDVIALIFNMLYFVGGIVAAVLVVVLFILASFDLLKFNINSLTQYISLLNNPNMYNKDTQDFKALMYYRNSTDTEPYTIFGQQELVKVMFRLATSVVGLLMLQVIILLVLLFVYKVVRGEPLEMGNIDFAKSAKPLGTVLVMVILAFVWTGLYQARFLNKIQPSIIYTHTNIEQVKNYIYDNLTTNEQFLNNLINGDLNECIKIMNQQTNDNRISRMIYTMSLYNFFKINISENEEAFNTVIRDIFSVAEIRVRAVNPINYMYYNQNVFLPNLYPILRPYIYGSNKAISTSDRDKIIRLDITQRINETNKRLMTLYKVPERKEQLSTYFIVAFVISLVFLFVVYGLYRENIRNLLGGDVMTKLKEIIMGVLSAKQTNLGTTNTVPTTSSGEPQSPSPANKSSPP